MRQKWNDCLSSWSANTTLASNTGNNNSFKIIMIIYIIATKGQNDSF